MASYVDMSLEDIIKKKKKDHVKPKKTQKVNKPKWQGPKQALPITDARNKIISKKRVQITDARDKLAELAKQKDARLKLEEMRLKRAMAMTHNQGRNITQNRGKFMRTVPNRERGIIHSKDKEIIFNKERVFVDRSRQVVSQPLANTRISRQIQNRHKVDTRKFTESRSIGRMPKPIVRTVENDIEIIDDPMGEDYDMDPKPSLNRKANLQLKIIAHNNDVREARSSISHRTAITEKERSPPRPPSILKKRPMAALRTSEKIVEKTEKPSLEYRIIVSNLRNSVTSGDIEELFGDVGGMVESRLVRPGTAEVIYKSQEDAQRAVDLYHNRQLDGQPMTCLLVTPRASASISKSSSKPALYSTNSNVEPDISTFHKVLFSNF